VIADTNTLLDAATLWMPWFLDFCWQTTLWLGGCLAVATALPKHWVSQRALVTVLAAAAVPLLAVAGALPEWILPRFHLLPADAGAVTSPDATVSASLAETFSPQGKTAFSPSGASSSQSPVVPLPVVLMLVWAAGCVATIGLLLWRIGSLYRFTRDLKRTSDDALTAVLRTCSREAGIAPVPILWLVPGLRSPMTWGIWRHDIALPEKAASWPDAQVASVLRHELAHIRRRDCFLTWLSSASLALLWFHPLAWSLRRRTNHLQEQACDRTAATGASSPHAYAQHLLNVASPKTRRGPPLASAIPMAKSSTLRWRLERILGDEPATHRPSTRKESFSFAALAAATLLPLSLTSACQQTQVVPPERPSFRALKLQPTPGIATDEASPPPGTVKIFIKLYERHFSPGVPLPETLANPRILSDGELDTHFSPQRKGVDLLTAPSILMTPGQDGHIEIIREFIYPVDFEESSDEPSGLKAVAFEKENIGITMKLNARPKGKGEGVILNYEVNISELKRMETVTHPLGGTFERPVFERISSQAEITLPSQGRIASLIGHRESLQTVEDKTSILGDIPFIGSLFTSSTAHRIPSAVAIEIRVHYAPAEEK